MADVKKYVSLDKLTKYDTKLKALIDTKDDAILDSAKSYAESLATNYDAAGSAAAVQVKLDNEVTRAKAREDEIAAANVATQREVDALETLVGVLPEGTTATSVVNYVDVKTAGIATDAALGELQGQVSGLQTSVQNIQKDYLVEADKTELSDAIEAEANRAKGIEGDLETRLAAVEADYLVEADKTALQGGIDAVSGKVTTLIGEDANKSVRTIANEELAKQLIAEGAQESLDTLAEIAAWIQAHPNDASAMNKAIDDLEALVGALPEGVTATTVVGYVQEVVAAEKSRAEGIEAGLVERIEAIETSVGEGGSVDDKIAAAVKVETDARVLAISEVQEDADKGIADAAAALKAAQNAATQATSLNDAMAERMAIVEGKAHEHGNKALLDTYTQTEENLADAVAKKHEHANKTVIDGITAENITTWNTVTGKADQTALQSEIDRAKAAEKANADAIAAFVEVSEEEINALFA